MSKNARKIVKIMISKPFHQSPRYCVTSVAIGKFGGLRDA